MRAHSRSDGSATTKVQSTLKLGVEAFIKMITAQQPAPAWPPRRILILKNDPVLQRFAQLTMSRFGLAAKRMCDESDMIEEVEAEAPALVLAATRCLADQRAFIDAVHRCGPIPIILVVEQDDQPGLDLGPCVDQLMLPCSAAELAVRLMVNLVTPVD